MNIVENLQNILKTFPPNVTLVAVSKTKPIEAIKTAYDAGQRIFGENKIQEMVSKWEQLPKDIQWHMIGHVQTNKVKYMAEFVSLIHGVDSVKLLIEIDKQAKKHQRIIPCLLQVHIAQEETKFGLNEQELVALIHDEQFLKLENIKVCGLMGMASFTDNRTQVANEFSTLKQLFDYVKPYKLTNCHFEILSMGMSNDYDLAITCGSNMVRIGSALFGNRN